MRRFHPPAGKFDGVIGGPPCQMFSRLAHMVRHNGHEPKFGNLIPEFERCVDQSLPRWFVMENVPDAPSPRVKGYANHGFVLNNRQCFDENGEPAKQNRLRKWTFGWLGEFKALQVGVTVFENQAYEYAAVGGSGGGARHSSGSCKRQKTTMPFNTKSYRAFETIRERQGLPGDYDLEPFTVEAKCKAVGNGVPLPMGRAIAKAVREALLAS